MGLFGKIKDILFVDDEELPVITKKEEEKKEESVEVRENIKRDVDRKKDYEDFRKEEKEEVKKDKKDSPFLSFDEEEFEIMSRRRSNYNNQVNQSNQNNYNENKNVQSRINPVKEKNSNDNMLRTSTTTIKKTDYKDYSRYEIKQVEEKKPFRVSPNISPVFGILDDDYKKEKVVSKPKVSNTKVDDVDDVMKKAFGIREKEEEKSVDDLIMDNIVKEEPLIEEVDDDVIVNDIREEDITPVEPIITHYEDVDDEEDGGEEEFQEVDERTSALEILDQIEKELNKQEEVKEDTLEGDLFNLIDSMYENRKDE